MVNIFADLSGLLAAEFSASPTAADLVGTNSTDRVVAALRARCRTGTDTSIVELVSAVGRSTRLDQLIAVLLDAHSDVDDAVLSGELRAALTAPGTAERRTIALLDLATDRQLNPLSAAEVVPLAGRSAALHRAVARYLTVLPPPAGGEDDFQDLARTASDLPTRLTWLLAAKVRGHGPMASGQFPDLADVAAVLADGHRIRSARPGITLLQWFAMSGDLNRPGEGDSGGLAVFLTTLGDALAGQQGIARVFTAAIVGPADVVTTGGWLKPRRDPHRSDNAEHSVLPLPVLASSGATPLPGDEPLAELTWWLRCLLPALDAVPDVAHLRYGSDVTIAVARALRRLGTRLVFGIAPDPHRMLLDSHHDGSGGIEERGMREDLHRMFAADLLSTWSDSVVAIAGSRQPQETPRYFPHVVRRLGTVQAIPEGVSDWRPHDTDRADGRRLIDTLFHPAATGDGFSGLTHAACAGSRVLLNVGRWNPLKQQDMLVEAWLRSGLPASTVLVLIGGSLSSPTPVEAAMRRRVTELLKDAGSAVDGRFAWLPRLANRDVRLLERALAEHLPGAAPHAYVCSSVKEEFGIALLEAMDAGMLVVAPRRGGAGSYVEHGVTGFLTDNTLVAELAADLRLVLGGDLAADRLATIAAEGQRRVRSEFRLDAVAGRFAHHYRGVAAV
jgi:D-inositol-3-phosphate glycosyltransferase